MAVLRTLLRIPRLRARRARVGVARREEWRDRVGHGVAHRRRVVKEEDGGARLLGELPKQAGHEVRRGERLEDDGARPQEGERDGLAAVRRDDEVEALDDRELLAQRLTRTEQERGGARDARRPRLSDELHKSVGVRPAARRALRRVVATAQDADAQAGRRRRRHARAAADDRSQRARRRAARKPRLAPARVDLARRRRPSHAHDCGIGANDAPIACMSMSAHRGPKRFW